jgi:hypothetical protein
MADFANRLTKNLYNYPNPCQLSTTLVLPKITESATVEVLDISENIVYKTNIKPYLQIMKKIPLDNLPKGLVYCYNKRKMKNYKPNLS